MATDKKKSCGRSCYLIGSTPLLISLMRLLPARGVSVNAVLTTDRVVSEHAAAQEIAVTHQLSGVLAWSQQKPADYLLSVYNELILPADLLAQCKKKAVNLHPGLLPSFAGVYPNLWALLKQAKQTGITWHLMGETVDCGDILLRQAINIQADDRQSDLNQKCFQLAEQSLPLFLDILLDVKPAVTPFLATTADYYSYKDVVPQDGLLRFVDSAEYNARLYRATHCPQQAHNSSSCKCLINDSFYQVGCLRILNENTVSTAGTVLSVDKQGLTIATRTAPIRLTQLQTLSGEAVTGDIFAGLQGVCLESCSPAYCRWLEQQKKALQRQELKWFRKHESLQPLTLPIVQQVPLAKADYVCLETSAFSAVDPWEDILASLSLYVLLANNQQSGFISIFYGEQPSDVLYPQRYWLPLPAATDNYQAYKQQLRTALSHSTLPVASDLLLRRQLPPSLYEAVLTISRVQRAEQISSLQGSLAFVYIAEQATLRFYFEKKNSNACALAREMQATLPQFMRRLSSYRHHDLASQEALLIPHYLRKPIRYKAHTENIAQLFVQMAQRQAQRTALTHPSLRMSYAELLEVVVNTTVTWQARSLSGKKVLVCCQKKETQIVAFLSLLLSGACYIPLDPKASNDYVQTVLEQSAAQYYVAEAVLPAIRAQYLEVTPTASVSVATKAQLFESLNAKDFLAYIIFTSGTTGVPKGVCINSKSLINTILSVNQAWSINDDSKILQFAPFRYDASIVEIFCALLSGATLVIEDKKDLLPAGPLQKTLERAAITHVIMPPSVLQSLVNKAYSHLRYIISAGEKPSKKLIADSLKHGYTFINAYGPTENTICATSYRCQDPSHNEIVGKPLNNTLLAIVDAQLNVLPDGFIGEIVIGGLGLTAGFLRQEDNDKCLVTVRIDEQHAMQAFRSGDRGIRLPDGNIQYLGRKDQQVKYLGHRIELSAIESLLVKCAFINSAHVSLQEQTLCADILVDTDKATTLSAVRHYIRETLPASMRPTRVQFYRGHLQKGWKFSRENFALQRINTSGDNTQQAATSLAETLRHIWQQALQVDTVGLDDNFFALGGHSLALMQVIAEIESRTPLKVSLSTFFDNPTIRALLGKEKNSVSDLLRDDLRSIDGLQNRTTIALSSSEKNYLITGASSDLALALTTELLRKNEGFIYLLYRSVNNSKAQLQAKLAQTVSQEVLAKRLVFLDCDLSHQCFALNEQTWELLANTVSHIYHCGAVVNHLLDYSALRATNVLSTVQLIQLAATGRRKCLNYISTLAAATCIDNQGVAQESFNDPALLPVNSNGYVASKWVSEALLQQAMHKGVAVNVFRPGWIINDLDFAANAWQVNYLYKLLAACTKEKCFPEWKQVLYLSPLQVSAEFIVSRSWQQINQVYHVVSSGQLSWEYVFKRLCLQLPGAQLRVHSDWQRILEKRGDYAEVLAMSELYASLQGETQGYALHSMQAYLSQHSDSRQAIEELIQVVFRFTRQARTGKPLATAALMEQE